MPDLYSAEGGSVFGMASPICWMRQALAPFLDTGPNRATAAEYRWREGVLQAQGDLQVSQHRSEAQGWAVFAYFSYDSL